MTRLLLGERDKAVYRWESQAKLDLHDASELSPVVTQSVVRHVWHDLGLSNPPLLKVDPKLNRCSAYGNRMVVTVGPRVNHVTLFHEMAHAMDVSLEVSSGEYALRPGDEVSGGSFHDDNWLGLYVDLLDRYLGGPCFNKLWLMKTLHDAGLSFAMCPKVRCI